MQRVRLRFIVLVITCGVPLVTGCRGDDSYCPAPAVSVNPAEIPAGDNETAVTVSVNNPNPNNGREVLTELYADSGVFGDNKALQTTYTCAHDISGEVEICVDAAYGPPIGPGPGSELVAAAWEYVRGAPTGYFVRPEDCLETSCATVVCPENKNACPAISELSVTPEVLTAGQRASVRVVADDPDDNPAPLLTTLSATAGSFADKYARETTYTCDPALGGQVEICVLASDGDERCDQTRCVTVECPGTAPDNTCPVIRDLSATPLVVPADERQTLIEVDAIDPDMMPEELRTILSASTGTFDDRNASATLFTCGAPGAADITVRATDGDRRCDKERTITVQCPSTVADNLCPKLYVINAIPSTIPEGRNWTEVQTRAEDFGDGPLDLVTTFYAFRGSFDDPNAKDTIYRCERSGLQEICVDAHDGACVKTLCMDVICPQDLGP
jgi:hypothetical protein